MPFRPCQFSHNTSNTESSNPMGGSQINQGGPHTADVVSPPPPQKTWSITSWFVVLIVI